MAPAGTTVAKMTANQKAPTVMTAVGSPLAKPAGIPAAAAPMSSTPAAMPVGPTNRVAVVSLVSVRALVSLPASAASAPRFAAQQP